jgi:hypothetical protein
MFVNNWGPIGIASVCNKQRPVRSTLASICCVVSAVLYKVNLKLEHGWNLVVVGKAVHLWKQLHCSNYSIYSLVSYCQSK